MKKFLRMLATAASLSFIFSLGASQCARAGYFVAKPFVVAESQDTSEFSAGVVTAPGSPFSIKVNGSPSTRGAYAGVSVTPKSPIYGLDTISFLLDGPSTTKVTVRTRRKGQDSFNTSFALAKAGMKAGSNSSAGFNRVTLDATQLSVAPDSTVEGFAITADTTASGGSFLVKDISVNGMLADKSLGEKAGFYKVINGAGVGPLETIENPETSLGTSTITSVSLKNGTSTKQNFFITILPPPSSPGITSYTQITFTVAGSTDPNEGVISSTSDASVGTFYLHGGHTAFFQPPSSMPCLSCNFYANSSVAQCTANTTHGVGATLAEVTLNVSGQGGETVDISEVNGVNALYSISLPVPTNASTTNYPKYFDNGYYLFTSQQTTPYGTFQTGQLIPVTTINNSPGAAPNFTGDSTSVLPYGLGNGNIGVYPFGCDLCTSRSKPGCTPITLYPSGNLGAQPKPYCQAQRYFQYEIGGTVAITLLAPYPYNGAAGSPRFPRR